MWQSSRVAPTESWTKQLYRVHSHAPSIRSHRGIKVVWPDFQPMRVPEEPVCVHLFRQKPVLTSLHLKSPVHVHRLCIDTKAKCRHLKKWPYKENLRHVFIRVYRLEIQSDMLVFSIQHSELLPLKLSLWFNSPSPPSLSQVQYTLQRQCMAGSGCGVVKSSWRPYSAGV